MSVAFLMRNQMEIVGNLPKNSRNGDNGDCFNKSHKWDHIMKFRWIELFVLCKQFLSRLWSLKFDDKRLISPLFEDWFLVWKCLQLIRHEIDKVSVTEFLFSYERARSNHAILHAMACLHVSDRIIAWIIHPSMITRKALQQVNR